MANDDKSEGSDLRDRPIGGESSDESREIDGPGASSGRGIAGGLTERLRGVLRDESSGDLLMDRGEVENGIVQWLRALDLHVLGACRADERLKPLLKLNISNGVAENRLVAQLSQHFEASEVGMLARCLCVPLVSIRVGKVNKQGNLLCPSTTRMLRICSDKIVKSYFAARMCISFTGDDGCTERLATLSNNFDSSEVVIEEISADRSGRSFLIKLHGSQVLYFWCSEKSKLYGSELLAKMKDLLGRKPTLSHLTGICESRLESFATHLRAYLLGSSNAPETDPIARSGKSPVTVHSAGSDVHSSSQTPKSSPCHIRASQLSKGLPSHQDSLSPRPNTLKDWTTINSSSMRSGSREKLRHGGDNNPTVFINSQLTSASSCDQTTDQCEDDRIRDSDGCDLLPLIPLSEMPCLSSFRNALSEMPCLSSSLPSSIPSLLDLPQTQIPASKSTFSPYYCWCPPCPSSLQYSVTPSHLSLPITYDESIPLPSLSSLISSRPPGSPVTSNLHIDVPKLPNLNLPSLFPDPIVRLPLPVSSLDTLRTPQQISSFTPFMSDPIIHTPVIDVCSSGQGYLVSAGPAISSAVPPLLPNFVNRPLIPNKKSAAEKSARETLRMLLGSTPASTCQKPMVFSPFLNRMVKNFSVAPAREHGNVGLHEGTLDIETVATTLPSMGLSSSRDKVDNVESGEMKMSNSEEDPEGCDSAEDSLSE